MARRRSDGRQSRRGSRGGQPGHLNDLPSKYDYLDFGPYRETLHAIINDPETETPLTIGIFGTWGVGKSTLLGFVKDDLDSPTESPGRRNLTVWFNAWKYDREGSLWRALLSQTVAALRGRIPEGDAEAQRDLQDLEEALYSEVSREELGRIEFDWTEAVKGGAKTGLHILATVPALGLPAKVAEELQKKVTGEDLPGLLDAFKRARTEVKIAQIQSIEQFESRFALLVERYVHPDGHLVVFVDDLDRCLPEKAVEVLEAIKLFLDVRGCVFVLGVDRGVIERGIRVKYRELAGEIDGGKYLEKIVQMPFDLPPLESQDVLGYVKKLTPRLRDPRCAAVFASGLREPNPRQIKRSISLFLLLSRLAEARRDRMGEINDVRLAKVVVIQQNFPALYSLLRHEAGLLSQLERYYYALSRQAHRPDTVEAEPVPELPERLAEFANLGPLSEVLTLSHDDREACFREAKPEDIKPYITLVKAVPTAAPVPAPRATFEPDTILIPAGPFLMGTSEEDVAWLIENTDWARDYEKGGWFKSERDQHPLDLPEYAIGRSPVTNREYQAFVEAAGHEPPSHWNGRTAPEEIGDHPVVNVSWRDALAYCRWLAEATGKPYQLPSEPEWEKAARGGLEIPGSDGRRMIGNPVPGRYWPWGNEFDLALCNTAEAKKGTTTPVRQYSPEGDSPYGCSDMAGNVWEWTRSLWGTEIEQPDFGYPYVPSDGREDETAGDNVRRVVRGGSWYLNRWLARCAYRNWAHPSGRGYVAGFRVVLAPPT